MADVLVVMNKGGADQIGPPREIYQRPATQFVAGFIGSPAMNFLPGEIGGDGRSVTVAGTRIGLPEGVRQQAGRRVTVGLRPEDLVPDAHGALEITIDLVEHLGTDTIVHGALSGLALSAKQLVVRLPGDREVADGFRIQFSVPGDKLHLFDAATGARV